MPRLDKVILTNLSALKGKYGTRYARVAKAIDKLVAADAGRGLTSQLVALDDPSFQTTFGVPRVSSADNQRQNKAAIDAVFRVLQPAYLLILGSVDVVPHQDLVNPVYSPGGDDDEPVAPGDLPYACDAPYSTAPQDFRGPTRVVGRLPDLTGGTDPSYLVKLLNTAAKYRSFSRSQYEDYFGITVQRWTGSTFLSLTNVFGNASNMRSVPPRSYRWPTAALKTRSHFINCHGGPADPQFYGQPKSGARKYPISHKAVYLHGKIARGTIAAVECCFGAELFDPNPVGGVMGICSEYLRGGAYGFLGSSTTAYGPFDGNAQADLICQFFLAQVLSGSSLGRAALEARQRFIRSAPVLGPTDLKTLAQFNLLGDPSIQPVSTTPKSIQPVSTGAQPPAAPKTFSRASAAATTALSSRAEAVSGERDVRRYRLAREGASLLAAVATVSKRPTAPSPAVRRTFLRAAREAQISGAKLTGFRVLAPPSAPDTTGKGIPLAPGAPAAPTQVLLAVGGHGKPGGKGRKGGPAKTKVKRIVVLEAFLRGSKILSMRRSESR
jgi:hypothetical protein